MIIFLVMCSLLYYESSVLVIVSVSLVRILTYRSLISKVIIVWLSSIFSFAKSWARVMESLTL